MHRFRSWTLDPPEWRTQRNRALSLAGGDGSALNVDFTTGVLDPKITHTRGSNATFINSSGLIQYAFSNRIPNSASLSGFTTTGVTAAADSNEPGPVVAPSGTQATKVTVNGGATTVNFNRNFGTGAGTSTGMTYSIYLKPSRLNNGSGFRYMIRNETTGLNTYGVDVLWANNPVTVNESIGAADGNYQLSGPDANGWYRLILMVTNTQLIRPGDNLTVYAGYSGQGTGFFDASGAYWVWGAQLEPGLTASPVYLTGATSTGYFDVPRFDYNPTTLESNGLLIEGNVTNVCEQGQYCWGAGTTISWSRGAGINVNAVNGTSGANTVPRIDGPDGGSLTGTSIFKDSGSTFVRLQYADFAVQANTTYTWSAYVRAPSGGNPYIRLGAFNGGTWLNTTGGCTLSSVTITNTVTAGSVFNGVPSGSWVRVWVTFTTQAAQTTATIAFYPDADTSNAATMYVWGSQVETGSGPSSVIPTGASSVTRVNDSVTFNDHNWFTSWKSTWFADYKIFNCVGTPNQFYARSVTSPTNNLFYVGTNSANSLVRPISRTYSNGVLQWNDANPILSSTSEFNKCAWVIDDTAKIAHAGVIDYTSTSGRSLPLGSGLSAYEIALNPTVGTSCSMWLRSLKYYPKALNNVELINLTKPTIPNEALSLVFDNTNYDSRIVFDRGTNATFVNSLGLVQWADANMQPNTAFTGITSFAVPGGWGGFVGPDPGGGGTRANFTLISPGTVKCTAGSILATNTCRCFLSTIFSYSLGIPLTIKATVVDKQWSSASANLTEFLLWTNSTTSEVTYYKNGVSIGDLSVAQAYTDWTAGDEITLIVVPTAINGVVRVGLGNNNNQPVNSYITFNKFIVLPGRRPQTLSNYYTHSNTGSGYFAPRLDYDPTNTGTLKGLLVENASTNFIQYSSDFTQASTWIQAGTGLIQTNNTTETTAPDGSNTASILAIGTSGIYIESTLGTLAANTQVTLSCWLKKRGTNSIGSLAIGTGSAWVASGASLEFNFDNPASSTLVNPGNVIRWGYTQYPNNWYRVYMVITTSATPAGAKIRFRVDSPIGADGYYLWGPQVEENRIMTSYIPTGNALSTIRNAESYYIPTSSWFTNNPYSMDFKYEMNDPSGLFIGRYCGTFSLGTGNPRLFIAVNYQGTSAAADDGRRAQLFDATLNLTPGSYPTTAASNTKLVFGVQSSLTSFMSTTSLINTNTSAAMTTGFDRLWIGREATSNRAINGWMKHIKYWSTRLGNNQLKYLSGS